MNMDKGKFVRMSVNGRVVQVTARIDFWGYGLESVFNPTTLRGSQTMVRGLIR